MKISQWEEAGGTRTWSRPGTPRRADIICRNTRQAKVVVVGRESRDVTIKSKWSGVTMRLPLAGFRDLASRTRAGRSRCEIGIAARLRGTAPTVHQSSLA